MIRRICDQNAVEYLSLPSAHKTAGAGAASNGHGMTSKVEGFRPAQIEKES
jgi:hypothetical protein